MLFDVLPLDDGEGFHDVVDVVFLDAVEVEERGVQFAAQKESAVFVPLEGWSIIATVLGKGLEVPGGLDQLKNTREYPS